MTLLSLLSAVGAAGNEQPGGGGDSSLTPALVGAIAGCAFTLTGERITRQTAERVRFRRLRALLVDELRQVMVLSRKRAVVLTENDEIPLHGPLPSVAWGLMQASGSANRLTSHSLSLLTAYYQRVADANYVATLIPNLVGVAAATHGPIGEAFLARARHFATEPYAGLERDGQNVLAAVDGGRRARG